MNRDAGQSNTTEPQLPGQAADQDQNAETGPPHAVVGSQVSFEEEMFAAAFDGVVVNRFWAFVKPYRRVLWIGVAGVLLFTVTQIAIPLIVRAVVDDALVQGEAGLGLLRQLGVLFIAVVCVNYAANITQELVVGRVAGHLLFDLRRAMYAHLQHVSLSFMDKTEVGRLMSRLQGDVSALQEFLETSIFAIGDFVLLIGIVAVMLWLDTRLGLLTLSVVPALFLIRIVWLPFAKQAFLHAREMQSAVNGALAENVHGIRTIQELAREQVNYDLFELKARDNLLSHLRASKFSNGLIPAVDTLTGGAMAIVVVVGGAMVIDDDLDLGVMVAFIFYVQRFFDPIRSLTIQYSIMQRAMAAGQRIFEVMDVPVDVRDRKGAGDLGPDDASIEFRNVTFGYAPGVPVVKDVSFRVEAGQTVALVGPTGSGKTSLTALAHRFYDVWEGSIHIGEHDLRDVRQASIGRNVAMVLQEPFLFTGSVYDNIRYHRRDAGRGAIEAAARAVGAHDFICRLPQGYQTNLEQRGSNISLGQRQLISFARALMADAPILVLDEATANIDSYTEREIQLALKRLLHGRTAVVIAHRLATIREADRIIVLRDGGILEDGTHRELLELNGLYARLYRLNYASFDDVASPASDATKS